MHIYMNDRPRPAAPACQRIPIRPYSHNPQENPAHPFFLFYSLIPLLPLTPLDTSSSSSSSTTRDHATPRETTISATRYSLGCSLTRLSSSQRYGKTFTKASSLKGEYDLASVRTLPGSFHHGCVDPILPRIFSTINATLHHRLPLNSIRKTESRRITRVEFWGPVVTPSKPATKPVQAHQSPEICSCKGYPKHLHARPSSAFQDWENEMRRITSKICTESLARI